MSSGIIGTGSCPRLSLARRRALGTRATVNGVPVDGAPDRLPDSLEFGLGESDDGRLGRKDALFKFLLVLSEERL